MKVEIFRRTVKDRRRGASWDLLQYMAEGVKACGDEPVIVNENMTGPWQKNEMEPTAPIGCMFGYGGTNQRHHTKGRRLDLVERAKKKGIYIITFDNKVVKIGKTKVKCEQYLSLIHISEPTRPERIGDGRISV